MRILQAVGMVFGFAVITLLFFFCLAAPLKIGGLWPTYWLATLMTSLCASLVVSIILTKKLPIAQSRAPHQSARYFFFVGLTCLPFLALMDIGVDAFCEVIGMQKAKPIDWLRSVLESAVYLTSYCGMAWWFARKKRESAAKMSVPPALDKEKV